MFDRDNREAQADVASRGLPNDEEKKVILESVEKGRQLYPESQ